MSASCRNSQARDWTCTTTVTRATACWATKALPTWDVSVLFLTTLASYSYLKYKFRKSPQFIKGIYNFFLFFGVFLGPYPWHMDVPRLGVKSELQLPATTATAIPDLSRICDYRCTAHGNAGSLTHWAGPWIYPVSSWILVRFIIAEPQWELLNFM